MLKSSKNSVLKILMMSSEFIYVARSYIWTWTQCSMPLALQLGVLESSQKRWCWSPVISTTCTHSFQDGRLTVAWRCLHPCSVETPSSVRGWEPGLCCPCQHLLPHCSDEGSCAVVGAAVCAGLQVASKACSPQEWNTNRSAAKSMLGMETSSRSFKFGDSGAQPRSSVCNRAMALQNSAPDTFGHNEQV